MELVTLVGSAFEGKCQMIIARGRRVGSGVWIWQQRLGKRRGRVWVTVAAERECLVVFGSASTDVTSTTEGRRIMLSKR